MNRGESLAFLNKKVENKNIVKHMLATEALMEDLYDFLNNNLSIDFQPSDYVNDPAIIAQHNKMVSVSVAKAIDLTGQVAADAFRQNNYIGVTGMLDFVRGAIRSEGGKSILLLTSTAKQGTVSRVVPQLGDLSVVVPRGDVDYVVTEYGIARLYGKNIRRRCLDLINIAHPKFRNQLLQAAKARKYIYEDQIELAWDQVPYPQELEHYDTLYDGTQIFFRPVRPTDESALSEMLYSLSNKSVQTRYMTHTMAFLLHCFLYSKYPSRGTLFHYPSKSFYFLRRFLINFFAKLFSNLFKFISCFSNFF